MHPGFKAQPVFEILLPDQLKAQTRLNRFKKFCYRIKTGSKPDQNETGSILLPDQIKAQIRLKFCYRIKWILLPDQIKARTRLNRFKKFCNRIKTGSKPDQNATGSILLPDQIKAQTNIYNSKPAVVKTFSLIFSIYRLYIYLTFLYKGFEVRNQKFKVC